MQNGRSPDKPAGYFHRLVGIVDLEPPLGDQEFELYERLRTSLPYAPRDIADGINCPRKVGRATRSAIRKLLSDPGFGQLLEVLERAKTQALAEEAIREAERKAEEARVSALNLVDKLAKIDAFHENQLNELRFRVDEFQHLIGSASIAEASLLIAQGTQSDWTKNQRALNVNLATRGSGPGTVLWGAAASFENSLRDRSEAKGVADGLSRFIIGRTLVSMTDGERATLRMADVLGALGQIARDDFLFIAVPIVWNGGDCSYEFDRGVDFRVRAASLETMKQLVAASLGTSAGAREFLNQSLRDALAPDRGLSKEHKQVVERYLFSGNRWMMEAEGPRAAGGGTSDSALRIGGFPGSTAEFTYDSRESLVTIAPSGSGKTQAHVLRNLLYIDAPALVLDVKGEMTEKTRLWREDNVGPTYVFNPTDPDSSLRYNPLDEIRADPDYAWDDARRLADFLMIPGLVPKFEYWETRARDMITLALLDVALNEVPEHRNMSGVLDRIWTSGDEEILAWCERLEESGNPQLMLGASALKGLDKKPRESVFDTARSWLEIWMSPAIKKISSESKFDPGSLREQNATLYLAVSLEDIKKFASVLRVLIGQALIKVYRGKPESDARTITFFLDELVRLGRMDVIEESLDVGRGYGIRLWLFCQNYGQLKTTYPNAQGMISNCAVRCYMNPDEDTARWLSENLGMRQGLLDGNRKPLVEHHVLTGPEFKDQMVVFSRGAPPARLVKQPAYADPECQQKAAGLWNKPPAVPEPAAQPAAATDQTVSTPADKPASRIDADAARPGERQAEGQTEEVNWDSVRGVTAPSVPRAPIWPFMRPGIHAVRLAILASACIFALGAIVWLLAALHAAHAENDALVAARTDALIARDTVEYARQALLREKTAWTSKMSSLQGAYDKYLKDFDATNAELARERNAHAATRARLVSVQRELDAARPAMRNSMPAPPPTQSPSR